MCSAIASAVVVGGHASANVRAARAATASASAGTATRKDGTAGVTAGSGMLTLESLGSRAARE